MLKLCRKPLPIIGKLSEMLLPGNYPGFLDIASSPRGPLDLKLVQCSSPSSSPRNLNSYDVVGVGLGIVAALEKKSTHDGRKNRTSDPHPVISNGQKSEKGEEEEEEEEDSEENYTFVTCHHGSNKSVTKVYYDGGDYCSTRSNEQHVGFVTCNVTNETLSENHERKREHVYYPTEEFLSSCNLCSKKLDGLDIYMYRGDKAFCSSECRATQMMNDERKESQCRSEASRRSTDVSNSREKIFFFSTAILAV